MIRFPYILEIWHEEDATLNPDGSWTAGVHQWHIVGKCNVRQNGQARQIKGQNGDSFLYSFEVTMPANTQPIPIGTIVRVLDNRGFHVFDRTPQVGDNPKNTNAALYTVQGFSKSGQRNEDVRLWL